MFSRMFNLPRAEFESQYIEAIETLRNIANACLRSAKKEKYVGYSKDLEEIENYMNLLSENISYARSLLQLDIEIIERGFLKDVETAQILALFLSRMKNKAFSYREGFISNCNQTIRKDNKMMEEVPLELIGESKEVFMPSGPK